MVSVSKCPTPHQFSLIFTYVLIPSARILFPNNVAVTDPGAWDLLISLSGYAATLDSAAVHVAITFRALSGVCALF